MGQSALHDVAGNFCLALVAGEGSEAGQRCMGNGSTFGETEQLAFMNGMAAMASSDSTTVGRCRL
jgi:hypothetical protein